MSVRQDSDLSQVDIRTVSRATKTNIATLLLMKRHLVNNEEFNFAVLRLAEMNGVSPYEVMKGVRMTE